MKKPDAPSLTNIIGILLVVVAIVSAGGIIYLSKEFCLISETLVYTDSLATDLRVIHDNTNNMTTITMSVLVDNPTSLDVVIHRIEFTVYADRSTDSITDTDKYIGTGSTSESNSTVAGNTFLEVPVSFNVLPNSLNMERFIYALGDGSSLWTYATGMVWIKIADYPDIDPIKIGLFYLEEVTVLYV